MSRLMACWQKRVGPLPSDINNAYHVACEPFNFYAVGCSKTYAGDCFPQRWKLVHESHWNLMGFWTAKWKFSREHVAELTSDILKFTIFRKDSDTCDIFVFRTCECAFYFYYTVFNNSYICWFTYLSTHYKVMDKSLRKLSDSHGNVTNLSQKTSFGSGSARRRRRPKPNLFHLKGLPCVNEKWVTNPWLQPSAGNLRCQCWVWWD